MIRKWSIYWNGAVRVRLSGTYPERFINRCIADHIYLWGVKKFDGRILAWMSCADFFHIRPAARRSRTKVNVVRRYGFPFLFRRFKQRRVLLGGGVLFFAALYWLGGYIWLIDIQGAKTVNPARIAETAAAKGLYVGARLGAVAQKEVERELVTKLPELAWAGVHFTGTRAVVEVVEKVAAALQETEQGSLLAAKTGTVTECIVIQGEKRVNIGDVVHEGDVLIQAQPDRNGRMKAEGIVKAKVLYESRGEASMTERVSNRSGRRDFSLELISGNRRLRLKEAAAEFAHYEIEEIVKKAPAWRNHEPLVELNIKVYHELAVQLNQRTLDAAQKLAVHDAEDACRKQIPEEAYVMERSVETEPEAEDVVRVKLRLATEEEIGKYICYSKE